MGRLNSLMNNSGVLSDSDESDDNDNSEEDKKM